MKGALKLCASVLGFTKESPTTSSDEDFIESEPPRLTALREQIEYYFSDANFETDKVFREASERDPDRYVPIELVMECNRIKKLKATEEEVAYVSAGSEYIELDAERKKIRSIIPFSSDPDRPKRTLRVSGFEKDVSRTLLQEFFESLGSFSIRRVSILREFHGDELVSTGTALVELGTEEEARNLVQRGIAYGEGTLDVQLLPEWQESVKAQREANAAQRAKGKKNQRRGK